MRNGITEFENGAAVKQTINGVPVDQIPIRAADTGIRLARLTGFVLREGLDDPIGFWIGGELMVYNDWRLRALQEREGVAITPPPESLSICVERTL